MGVALWALLRGLCIEEAGPDAVIYACSHNRYMYTHQCARCVAVIDALWGAATI